MERPSEWLPESLSLLDRGLRELGLPASEAQREALLDLARLVDHWGARINLTGHRGFLEVFRGLVLGSIALVAELPEAESLVDLGSGAGFPGLPAAILRPRCRVTLVEARLKRHHFQRAAIRELGLDNARPILGRAEELEPSQNAVVVAQAVARPESALELMAPWAAPGGIVILPGGIVPPSATHPSVSLERMGRYRVPCGGPERTLWVGRKLG